MDVIFGLGKAGCNIADCFKQYSQYEVHKIDAGIKGELYHSSQEIFSRAI